MAAAEGTLSAAGSMPTTPADRCRRIVRTVNRIIRTVNSIIRTVNCIIRTEGRDNRSARRRRPLPLGSERAIRRGCCRAAKLQPQVAAEVELRVAGALDLRIVRCHSASIHSQQRYV